MPFLATVVDGVARRSGKISNIQNLIKKIVA